MPGLEGVDEARLAGHGADPALRQAAPVVLIRQVTLLLHVQTKCHISCSMRIAVERTNMNGMGLASHVLMFAHVRKLHQRLSAAAALACISLS